MVAREAGRWSAGGGLLGGLLGGAVVCWRSAGDGRDWEMMPVRGNGPAAICGGNSAVFNQPLTTFLVVAMDWRLTVF